MKLIALAGLIALLFAPQGLALEKTQEEAHRFLIDGGQVSADSVVESFTLDRTGNVRIRLVENDYVLNFGLEEDQDTYSIAYMNKKKNPATSAKAGTVSENDELTKLIGENVSILKGGKVVKVHRPTTTTAGGNKSDVAVEYKLGTKTYTVSGRYNQKSGTFSLSKIEDGAPKIAST